MTSGLSQECLDSIYSQLPRDSKTIRLLKIIPGQRSETIQCELQVTTLDSAPPFEALSYVWGNPNPPDEIICNKQRKSVTPNLGAALKHLRLGEEERLVWIGVICVNQDALDERSHQV
jgi:hypothetical protein